MTKCLEMKYVGMAARLALAVSFVCGVSATAQVQTPDSPASTAAAVAALQPGQAAAVTSPFPPVNPRFFTAAAPTVDTVNKFLKALWGYDENRIWSVAAIQKTKAAGVSKVVVYVADKTNANKAQTTVFYVLPDGQHAIADSVIDFGATPFVATRKLMQEKADGPARGAAGRELLLVEFTDLQCPHCKDAQPIMEQLATDFPQARFVLENFPLVEIHPFAYQAAAEGLCVRKAKGDDAYFKYVDAVFDTQGGLTDDSAQQTMANAVTKAGGDPVAAAACSKTPAIKDALAASMALAKEANVDSTPTLFVNGFQLPLGGVPYELLKKIIAYRATEDGVPTAVQPSLKTLK